MAEMLDPKNADKRTAARYIQMGLLDEKGYEKHVKGLPDVAEKGAAIDTVMDDVDFDDEEDDVEDEA
jgi:hypothetical protein